MAVDPVRRRHAFGARDPRRHARLRPARDSGADHRFRVEEGGEQLYTTLCVDRGQMIAGLLHGVEGMHVGGTRRLRVAPHLGYAEAGVPGVIPPNALLTVEVTVVDGPEGKSRPEG